MIGTHPISKPPQPHLAARLGTTVSREVGDNDSDNVRKGFFEEVEFRLRGECSAQSHGKSAAGGGMASAKALRQGWAGLYWRILPQWVGWREWM